VRATHPGLSEPLRQRRTASSTPGLQLAGTPPPAEAACGGPCGQGACPTWRAATTNAVSVAGRVPSPM